jgi:protein disulfide-isomerase-like protein
MRSVSVLALVALGATSVAAAKGGSKACTGHFGSSGVVNLCAKHFPDASSDKVWLIKFYAPWCGHCKAMIPAMKQLGKAVKDDPSIGIGGVDCTVPDNQALCGKYGVQGYPTIKAIVGGKPRDYQQAREAGPMEQYIRGLAAKRGSKGGSSKCPKGIFKSSLKDSVVALCDKHFPDAKSKFSWVTAFYNKEDFEKSDEINRLALELGNEPADKNKSLKKNYKQSKRIENIMEKYSIKGENLKEKKGGKSTDALAKFGGVCCDCDDKQKKFCEEKKVGTLPAFTIFKTSDKKTETYKYEAGKFDTDDFAKYLMVQFGLVKLEEAGEAKKEAPKEEL